MPDCRRFESRIVHNSTVVGFIRNGTNDDALNFVEIGRMSDDRTLHFCTLCVKDPNKLLFLLPGRYKLIATYDPSDPGMDIWIGFLVDFLC